ncbi:Spy/CpxP family protein refolding chaperone [Legionella sp. W05-934-2]|jgi:Spy/CpxP family protein refolding chaperone|uniref:Spy/CpxP family protein refolding chaperone n=1 Tax=Legionella sp. W05-934-2 TaxID=1198649 RepID=UPI0034624331
MKIKQAMSAVVAVVSLLMTSPIFAEHQMGQRGGPCMMKMKKVMDQMNLTSEQRDKIRAIRQSMHSQLMASRDDMKSFRTQMLALVMSDNLDEAALNELINKKTAAMAKKMKLRMMFEHQVYQMLNPDQKIIYKQAMEQIPKNCGRGKMNYKNF